MHLESAGEWLATACMRAPPDSFQFPSPVTMAMEWYRSQERPRLVSIDRYISRVLTMAVNVAG